MVMSTTDPPAPPGPPPPGPYGATGGPGGPRPPNRGNAWAGGRIIAVLAGSVLVLVGLVALALGGFGVVVDRAVRDEAGFLTSPSQTFTTSGYAVTSERIDINTDTPG